MPDSGKVDSKHVIRITVNPSSLVVRWILKCDNYYEGNNFGDCRVELQTKKADGAFSSVLGT